MPEEVGRACDNCMGRIVAVRDRSGLTVKNFDVFGQPIEEWRSIAFGGQEKGLFDIHREYDRWGVQKSQRIREFEPQDPGVRCRNDELNKFICNFDETLRYAYNRAGQLHAVNYDNAPYARFAYDAFGATVAKWTSDGTTSLYSFGLKDHWLSNLITKISDHQTFVQNVEYSYDSGGNIVKKVDDQPATPGPKYNSTFDYAYDAANRLKGFGGVVTDAESGAAANVGETYDYDNFSRMSSVRLKDGTLIRDYRYADSDNVGDDVPHPLHAPRIIEWGDQAQHLRSILHYDDWGNLAKVNQAQTNSDGGNGELRESRVLHWDAENRLSGVTIKRGSEVDQTRNGTIDSDYIYDASGQRALKSAPRLGATNQSEQEINLYVSDFFTRRWGENTAALHVSGGVSRVGSIQLVRTNEDTQRYPYFYHSDLPNGSVTTVTRPSGSGAYDGELIERLEYTPYGRIIERARTVGPIAQGRSINSPDVARSAGDAKDDRRLPLYAYSGKELDLETGYSYFGARYYDSGLYLWLNADFISRPRAFNSGELASYSFASDNPISEVDNNGQSTISETWSQFRTWLSAPFSQEKWWFPSPSTSLQLMDPDFPYSSEPMEFEQRQPVNADIVGGVLGVAGGLLPFAGPVLRGMGFAAEAAGPALRSASAAAEVVAGATTEAAGATAEGLAAGTKPFAMGLDSAGLDAFAEARGATTYKNFADPMKWKAGVMNKLSDPNVIVHFNLDGVDVWRGVSRAAGGRNFGATDWELLLIRQNPQWWDTLQFWKGGSPAANPFAK